MKTIAKLLCSIFGHKIHVRTGSVTERQECLRCGKVWIFETRPTYGVGTSEAERVFSQHNVNVDLPDTAAQDSASPSNNTAVSG